MYNLFSIEVICIGCKKVECLRMGLRVPFALVAFGFNSPIKFIIYQTSLLTTCNRLVVKKSGLFVDDKLTKARYEY